jgi:chorismate mutase
MKRKTQVAAEHLDALKERAHDLLFVAHYQGQRHPSEQDKEEVESIVETLVGAAKRGLLADELASALRELHKASGSVKSIYAAPISSPSHTEVWGSAMDRAKELLETIDKGVDVAQVDNAAVID